MPTVLYVLLAVYCGASLLHFAHNAQFLSDYPNLPHWLTQSKVYFAWLAVTAVGVLGVVLLRRRRRVLGLLVIAAYAALGFAGLDHYWVAPLSAHTFMMNATILFEVAAASLLLIAAATLLLRHARPRSSA